MDLIIFFFVISVCFFVPIPVVTHIHVFNPLIFFRIKALTVSLKALKLAGVHGIAVEVWWGVVEQFFPHAYNWSLYEYLFKLVSETGLKLQVALSFHSNAHVSSKVQGMLGVSLPQWIMEVCFFTLNSLAL